jgi:iron complex transport system ATP-binding protein
VSVNREQPPVLELADATVVKNGARVLDGVTLTIRTGEHTAIIGPNGAGKSQLIKLLTRHDYALSRDADPPPVRIFGESRWNVDDLRSRLGIVTDDLHRRFVAGISAGQVTAEMAVISGLVSTQGYVSPRVVTEGMRQLARAALARVGALDLLHRPLDEMSTGEARRILIARALVTPPLALVLDEPTTGLDVAARDQFLASVEAVGRHGTTLIVVTHHVEEIPPVIERVVLLKRGRVAAIGPKDELLTSARLTDLFETAIDVVRLENRYFMRAGAAASPTFR